MNRLDEMIYHVDQQAKLFEAFPMANMQVVEGVGRPCCTICGNCPAAEAEWLRAIRDELPSESSTAKPQASTGASNV